MGRSHETWKGWGHEFKIFRYLLVRGGRFEDRKGERIGNTYGMGINTGIFEISFADDSDIYSSPTRNYRISFLIKSSGCAKLPRGTDIALELFYPGLGFLSNQNPLGFIYSGIATVISTIYTNTGSRDTKRGMGILYFLTNASSLGHLILSKYRK